MNPADAIVVLVTGAMLGPVIWRITRFLLLDALIDGPRELFRHWLGQEANTRRFSRAAYYLRTKLLVLLECAFCVSIWVSAGALVGWSAITWTWPGWLFIPTWLSGSTWCMVLYRYIDPPDPCLPQRICGE